MTDLIIGVIVVVIIGAAVAYIYREKKRGTKCIGCPSAGTCAQRSKGEEAGCCCGCGSADNQ